MPTVAELKLELDDAQTLKMISSAFTEASAARIQKIKKAFETNTEFYEEISHIYHLVQLSAAAERKETKEGNGKSKKRLLAAITSNQRFYGNLNVNIMHKFLEDIEKDNCDVVVCGATGRDFMNSVGYAHPYEMMQFVKDNPSAEETRKFLDKTKPYETVMLYFPKFMTLMTQTVGITDIAQAADQGTKIPDEELHILFEPEFSKILDFFERQVRSLLFLRVMLESDLARTAARLLTMSSAEERSNEMIKVKKSQLRKINASITNAKLLETFSAIGGWKKK